MIQYPEITKFVLIQSNASIPRNGTNSFAYSILCFNFLWITIEIALSNLMLQYHEITTFLLIQSNASIPRNGNIFTSLI